MSEAVDVERREGALDARIERAKQVLRDLQAVLVAHVGAEPISATARRLGMSRDRVRWMERVLGLRNGRLSSGWLTTRTGARGMGDSERAA